MKLKRTKAALISAIALCLLLTVSYTQAVVTLTNIEHPSEVRIGNTFTVVVEFDYGSAFSYCLYGDYIWLYYAVGLSPYIDLEGTQYIAKSINTPTPSTVSISVDTSEITCAVDDTFRFRIKYVDGYRETSTSEIWNQGNATSGEYDVTIVENPKPTRTSVSFLGLILPLFAVATIILLRRRCKQ